ncbi:hypothetical protein [Pandoraea pulmonicola]|uniref:Uncharacterized protein n=1 Tax=Pandoraea pulmonicola TaxID=93221 RepID=A0AAJ4Z949_PANPU|nr:hypothetical protein [Pandoraea pulmonicola]AJC21983.1 hypothetical protein RO07_18535 [Pandoraea pulmonicola]SUA89049.1 Uncharacterised protein [Pandoraea pulmonicola]
MRILTTDMQYRVRQGAGALAAAVLVTFGLCAAPAQAQEVLPAVRAPFMQLAMLTGSTMPGAAVALTPTMSISDAETAVVAAPVAVQVPEEDTPAAANTASPAGTDDRNTPASAAVPGVPLAAARIDDEQLRSQRGRNLPDGTMLKSPGMSFANGVTLWDEMPGAVTPTPRPQQLSNGVNNVQVTRVIYTTR